MSSQLITVREAQGILNCSSRHIYNLLNRGIIKGIKLGNKCLINRQALMSQLGLDEFPYKESPAETIGQTENDEEHDSSTIKTIYTAKTVSAEKGNRASGSIQINIKVYEAISEIIVKAEQRGRDEGESSLARLMSILFSLGLNDDAVKAAANKAYRHKLYEKYEIL